jgi:Arc/MetJ-type ribon-helix-helix transcriptional regulator
LELHFPMSTEMSADNERYLQELVERGIFHNRAAAVDAAIALLRQREQLRSDVQAGIEQADRGEVLDGESVFQRLLARAQQIEAKAR